MSVKSAKISGLKATGSTDSTVSLSWSPVSVNGGDVTYQVCVKKGGAFGKKNERAYEGKDTKCTVSGLSYETKYDICVRCGSGGSWSKWSDKISVTTLDVPFAWAKCPSVDSGCKYSVDKETKRVAVKTGYYTGFDPHVQFYSTIVSTTVLPRDSVSKWSIKILKSEKNDAEGIRIGVAPRSINPREKYMFLEHGWYLDCYTSVLNSGAPQHYSNRKYGLNKGKGACFHTGDVITVVMDPENEKLSFMVNGVDFGTAFEDMPADEYLVPCVILGKEGDSVEIDPSEVEETVSKSVPAPSGLRAVEGSSYDSIKLSWKSVNGASFYQIDSEVYETLDSTTENEYVKNAIPPGVEFSFRVRTVKGKEVSEWSKPVKGNTRSDLDFSKMVWRKCPYGPDSQLYYTADETVAMKIGGWCLPAFIKGNTPLPINQVTSWIFKPMKGCEGALYGIAVSHDDSYMRAPRFGGWFYQMSRRILASGPPHNYSDKYYGECVRPKKDEGDTLIVTFNPENGSLSFELNGKDFGVAYEGIPIDKALVPAVKLFTREDMVAIIP